MDINIGGRGDQSPRVWNGRRECKLHLSRILSCFKI